MRWLVHADLSPPFKASAEQILDYVGNESTLFTPTFTYSYCKGVPFDKKGSRPESGLFGEYLLSMAGSVRSGHPIFSFAGIGPEAGKLLHNVSASAFGKGSLFDQLAQAGGKLLFAGAPFQSCTYVHFVEQLLGVSYRTSKWFSPECEYFVRPLDGSVVTNLSRLEERLAFETTSEGWQVVAIDHLIETTRSGIEEDPYFLLERPPAGMFDL